jgi:hypothetical protein
MLKKLCHTFIKMANITINDLALASAVTDSMQFEVDTAGTTSEKVTAAQIKTYVDSVNTNTISYAATVNLDLAALTGVFRTISLTGNLTFTTSNRATGRRVTLRLIADASTRTLTFPAGWKFVGTKPANIAANKVGMLTLMLFGTADTDGVAAWGVEA